MKLIVIIRDPGPLVFMEEPVEHRRVEINLTPKQIAKLKLRWVGVSGGKEVYEQIGTCFIEGKEDAPREEPKSKW